MKYDSDSWSYGVELEYGNCHRFAELPDGAQWNDKDNTCVSSTGIANDPSGKLYAYGGEINTRPTNTIIEQIDHISKINGALLSPKRIVNYRSNLHIHIRVPGLKDDLESCKKLLKYITRFQEQAFEIVEQIPVPDRNLPALEYEWAVKRMKRRYKSHQHKLPAKRIEAMLAATTTQEFFEEHAHRDAKGNPSWFQCPRAGINLRQMWEETNTIEFRHFPGTLHLGEMESSIKWCKKFLEAALGDEDSPLEIFNSDNFSFPKFEPYEFETEQGYQFTNFDTNTKGDIIKRLDALRERINIDDIENVSSKDVYPIIQELKQKGY
jgi:hypothetical protein